MRLGLLPGVGALLAPAESNSKNLREVAGRFDDGFAEHIFLSKNCGYFKSFHIYGKKQPPLLLWFRWSASLLFEDIFFHHNLAGDLPPLGSRPPPLPQLSPRVRQSPPSPGEEGLDLHLPYQMHTWRLASIKRVSAWRLPSGNSPIPLDLHGAEKGAEAKQKK